MKGTIEELMSQAAPVELAGSLLAAPGRERPAYAHALACAGAWVHVDVIDDAYPLGAGVSPDLLPQLCEEAAPVDVHLLVRDPADWVDRMLQHRPARLTLQAEDLTGAWGPAFRDIRRACDALGVQLWAAFAPVTPPPYPPEVLAAVDGVLVMLAPPGVAGTTADPQLIDHLAGLTGRPCGVDGGVTEAAFAGIRQAGGSYAVLGRRLWHLANRNLQPLVLNDGQLEKSAHHHRRVQ